MLPVPARSLRRGTGGLVGITDHEPEAAFRHRRFDWKHPLLVERVLAGDFSAAEAWCGDTGGWRPLSDVSTVPSAVIPEAQTEFTLHEDAASGEWLAIHSIGFGGTTIGLRSAPRPTGPFSQPLVIHRPPESDLPGLLVYAAKAHPELQGAPLILTYVANALDFGRLVNDASLYFPRFLRAWPVP